jgi:peptide subunit release factor 1 (eRF1)
MTTREQVQRLIQRTPTGNPVMSLYLDMSVTSENKRTYNLFLQQQRAAHAELDSDRETHHREPLGIAFERVENWIENDYQQSNRGLALFVELKGDWLEAVQVGAPLPNKLVISDRPVIGPLTQLLSRNRHYGIALVDREHCRLLSCYLGALQHQKELTPDAYPTPHDVHKGGYAAKDYQKYKAEEARQFFRMFAQELCELDRRLALDHWILLGTVENAKHFSEFLPKEIEEKVIHTAQASVDASDTDILERLSPFFAEHALHDEASTVDLLRDRVRNRHFAISGVRDTLEQLQEGKVDTLVIARDLQTHGAQCTRCSFYLDRRSGACPYCGGELRDGIDLVESMIRMATEQEVDLEFVDPAPMSELHGVGALLRF